MKRYRTALQIGIAALAAAVLVAGCAGFGAASIESLTVQPSARLQEQVQDRPEDFRWESLQEEGFAVTGSADSATLIELHALQINDKEVASSVSSQAIEATPGDLEAGVPGNEWLPGSDWVPGNSWIPGMQWFPARYWDPATLLAGRLDTTVPNDQAVLKEVLPLLNDVSNAVVIFASGPGVEGTRPLVVTTREELPEDLTVRPSDTLVSQNPSDFTWLNFSEQIQASGTADQETEVSVRAIRILGGEVTDSAASPGIIATPDELSRGIPGSRWMSSTNWVPGNEWFPDSDWSPQGYVTTDLGRPAPEQAAVVEAALPTLTEDYGTAVNAVIVYAAGPKVDSTTPFAVVLN